MDDLLAEALYRKNLLTRNLEIAANFETTTIGMRIVEITGLFLLNKIERSRSGELILVLIRKSDGTVRRLLPKAVVRIDGMLPKRFASVYGISKLNIGYSPKGF